jgi:ADP-heptose:LPS heptosyltransferase
VTGSAGEAALAEGVVREAGTGAVAAAGRFSLQQMIALIAGADFFISNSTGPLHLARALGRPLLGIYTTVAACHPKRWGPYGWEESHTLLPPGESFDRFERDKRRSEARMRAITPAMITAAVERVLAFHPTRLEGG